MAHFYNVPVSVHGQWSDSVTDDGQSIFEHTYTALMGAFSGANILVGAGSIQETLTISHTQLVIDDEINKTCFRALEGFLVDEGRLAVDAIARVGPGSNFLADEHTLEFLRGERYTPALFYRGSRQSWEADGWKTFRTRAKEQAKALLEEHEPNPLPEDIGKALDEYVRDAFKALEK
jgi:trimethylamine--corrinoid protein Co-methyltransferase